MLKENSHKNNFDALRLFASIIVILAHCYPLRGLDTKLEPLYYITHCNNFGHLGVSIFLSISGYLICNSLVINSNFIFFYKRLLRIIPPLILVVFLTIFLLGPVFTSFSLKDYFTTSETYHYFLNISLFRMEYRLPGVFLNLPYKGIINGSLWTLAYEFFLYVILYMLFKLTKHRIHFIVISTLLLLLIYFLFNVKISANQYCVPFLNLSIERLLDLSIYFFSGACFYLFTHKLNQKNTSILFLFSLALFVISILTKNENNSFLFYFIVPAFTFSIALNRKINLQALTAFGDFSYGIYIYAFPLQQILVLVTNNKISVLALFGLATILSYIFGAFSWYLVEQKSMKLKNLFSK